MKRIYKVYRKTVSIVNETSTVLYENLAGMKKGFLLESYDKNYDRYTFLGVDPEEILTSEENALIITDRDGRQERRDGNPLQLLKAYYDEFEIHRESEAFPFSGGLVGSLGYDFVRYTERIPDVCRFFRRYGFLHHNPHYDQKGKQSISAGRGGDCGGLLAGKRIYGMLQ